MQNRDIWIITDQLPGGELDDALTNSIFAQRIIAIWDLKEIGSLLETYTRRDLSVGFQGEWWTRPDIQDIIVAFRNWELAKSPVREVHWLPDNWFLPNSWVPELIDGEAAYEWMEKHLL